MFFFQNISGPLAIDCVSPYGIVTVPGSTIITPDYPHNYGNYLDCQVTLTFETRVEIVFEDFELEKGLEPDDPSMPEDCKFDWLEVHDGVENGSDLIGEKLCGNSIPSPIESSGNSLTLVFHSDGGLNKKGFKIKTYQGKLKYTEIKNLKLDH